MERAHTIPWGEQEHLDEEQQRGHRGDTELWLRQSAFLTPGPVKEGELLVENSFGEWFPICGKNFPKI